MEMFGSISWWLIVFQRGYTNLHSHLSWINIPLPKPCQHSVMADFIFASQMGAKWYLTGFELLFLQLRMSLNTPGVCFESPRQHCLAPLWSCHLKYPFPPLCPVSSYSFNTQFQWDPRGVGILSVLPAEQSVVLHPWAWLWHYPWSPWAGKTCFFIVSASQWQSPLFSLVSTAQNNAWHRVAAHYICW